MLFWLGLGLLTFVLLVVGYGIGFWSFAADRTDARTTRPDSDAASPILRRAMRFLNRFVDSNDREIRRLQPLVDETNALEAEYEALSDDEIRAQFAELRAEILEAAEPDEPSDDELHHPDLERRRELKARAPQARERPAPEGPRRRPAGGLRDDPRGDAADARDAPLRRPARSARAVLHQGKIAEMQTGEGKTLVAPLAAVLNAMTGRGVHVVTVNDYLARRDPQWMGPVFHFLGLSVGMITHDASFVFDPDYPTTDERLLNLRPVTRREAYAADITYGTNNEFGFDYLRDNMVLELDQRVQRERYFAIVDEVDNILIDEARTPLIISGQAEESADLYFTFARLVPRLKERPEGDEEGGDYFIDLKDKAVSSTEEGIEKMEGWLGVENMYDADPRLARHFEQALRAHALYKRDRDYIVKDGEIVIVDEFTGRQMPGRRWSEGLHQAIEAKEGLRVQRESVTLATITFQNYFRLYDKLSGMTGTAMTEAEEFHKIYKLEVVAIPTHRPMVRDDDADLVYRDEHGQVQRGHRRDRRDDRGRAGRSSSAPSRSRSPRCSSTMLKRRGIKHEVLNAKFHEKEARDRRPGRPVRRGDDRHQHGRPRHGHPARRQPGRPRLGHAPQARPQPGRGRPGDLRRGPRRGQGHHRGGPRPGRGRRRPAHHRHRAARLAPHRQPAPRPRRPPGRPGLVALLPVARGRPDEALRQRAGHRPDGAARARRRRGHRVAARVARRSRSPRAASRASTSTSASASSSTTTSSTSSARRSTPSATRSSTTRT